MRKSACSILCAFFFLFSGIRRIARSSYVLLGRQGQFEYGGVLLRECAKREYREGRRVSESRRHRLEISPVLRHVGELAENAFWEKNSTSIFSGNVYFILFYFFFFISHFWHIVLLYLIDFLTFFISFNIDKLIFFIQFHLHHFFIFFWIWFNFIVFYLILFNLFNFI